MSLGALLGDFTYLILQSDLTDFEDILIKVNDF